jgi:replicative DNA helicase
MTAVTACCPWGEPGQPCIEHAPPAPPHPASHQAWPDPLPLRERRTLPRFPTDTLPDPIGRMAGQVAEFTQTDPGMAGTCALVALAAAAGGRCEVEVRAGWREPLNLFAAVVADPGERKSAVQAMMGGPLLDAERQLVEDARPAIIEAQTTRDVGEKAAQRAAQAAGQADDQRRDALVAEAISAAMMAEAVVVPTLPRIVADDVTPEAAGSLLAEQSGRLAIVSAEGGIFDVIAGRYSGNVPNLDVFLKGHAGDALKVDRKGRPPEYVPRPALTIGLMVQPAVLTAIGEHRSFRGRGLLARFLYATPPSKVGRRNLAPGTIDPDVSSRYRQAVRDLAVEMNGWTDPAVIALTAEGWAVLLAFQEQLEPRLGPAGDLYHVQDWASKLTGAVARIAGLLHLGDHPAGRWMRGEVSGDAVRRAVRLADYFLAHALAAFDEMRADPVTADAEYLLTVIRRLCATTPPPDWSSIKQVSRRDLHVAASRSRFPTAADLDQPLAALVEHGWLIAVAPDEPTGPGRRPSPRYAVHPATETTQTTE